MLCMSLLLNWIPCAILGILIFNYPNGLIYSALLIIASGLFAVSPFKERIGCKVLGCRPATMAERQKLKGAWDSVVSALGQALDRRAMARFARVNLFVSDDKLPSAFAIGRNTVCVTKGLLNFASPGDIGGVLAHEAGHLHFGDAERLAVVLTAYRLGIASYRTLDTGLRIIEGFSRSLIQPGRQFAGSGGVVLAIIGLIACLVTCAINVAMRVLSFVFQIVIEMSLSAAGRKEEFRADLFARNIGFGQQLARFLRQIEALDAAPKDIRSVLYRPHPPTAERIDRLIQDVS